MEKTFAMIKPEALLQKVSWKIIELIELNGFVIKEMRKHHLSKDEARVFYGIHKERPWFEDLISTITKYPVILLSLERENAVLAWRKLMGATNPQEAEIGTIRKMFAQSIGENMVHGSDSLENAKIELNYFFKE